MRRLAIAIGVPYFGWWAFYGFASYVGYGRYQARLNTPAGRSDIELQIASEGFSRSIEGMVQSFVWGIIVPLLAALLTAIALWVYRGFRPNR